ncbi:MAG: GNAT family N-acetyltransferase [Hyphomonadaceae bacterium]
MPILRDGALVLRPLTLADVPALHIAHADPVVHLYWSSPAHASLQETQAYVEATLALPGAQVWAIEEVRTVWGRIGLFSVREGVGELGIILRRDAQGRRLARRAIELVASHAFEAGLHRLVADIDPENTASIRAFEAAGFRREGLLRASWRTHLGLRDTVLLARLKPGL